MDVQGGGGSPGGGNPAPGPKPSGVPPPANPPTPNPSAGDPPPEDCPGGVWDEEFGDFGVSAALGGTVSYSSVNMTCRSNGKKVTMKQVCIGGGFTAGVAAGWTLGGVAFDKPNAADFRGWDDWAISVGGGIFGGQANSGGGQTTLGSKQAPGIAAVRCNVYYLKPSF